MRQFIGRAVLIGSLTVAGSAVAEPEMRCRMDGAYIKVYGKTALEQRDVCERQGGEMTRYAPQGAQGAQGGGDARGQAMQSIFGRDPGEAR